MPVLGRQAQYTFTDVSPVFLSQASEQFSDYPNLRTAVLDIERDPKEQGFEAGKYDVVIAANVLHATADLRKTMANVSTLLAPGGMLFIAEAVKPAPWIDLTFGLTEGWWRFGDLTRRKDGPLIEVDGWRRLLVETHFEDVSAFSGGAKARDRAASQALITAKWPDKIGGVDGSFWAMQAVRQIISKWYFHRHTTGSWLCRRQIGGELLSR